MAGNTAARVSATVPTRRYNELESNTLGLAQWGWELSAAAYNSALSRARHIAVESTRGWAASYDVLVTPTIAHLPPEHDSAPVLEDGIAAHQIRLLGQNAFLYAFNVSGQPAISVPCGWVDGVPVGLQIVGHYGDDAGVLALAAAFEQAAPWADRVPLITAAAG